MPKCSSRKTHWERRKDAEYALALIRKNAPLNQVYIPTDVIRCPRCKQYVLTGSTTKPWKHGRGVRKRQKSSRER